MKQNDQNDIQRELDRAFTLLAAIPVSGDGVELMAGAKERLRTAYRLAGEAEEAGDG
ncbi:MAG: hypothetical protein HFF64_06400 [Oscillospiraceae bacterium]|nr:hypothetical protein [Oscillospiraceae bacterium]